MAMMCGTRSGARLNLQGVDHTCKRSFEQHETPSEWERYKLYCYICCAADMPNKEGRRRKATSSVWKAVPQQVADELRSAEPGISPSQALTLQAYGPGTGVKQ